MTKQDTPRVDRPLPHLRSKFAEESLGLVRVAARNITMQESMQKTSTAYAVSDANVHAQLADLIVRKCSADDATRRGLCMLNARRFDDAIASFNDARGLGASEEQLRTLLGAACLGNGDYATAATEFTVASDDEVSPQINAIRAAHALWSADRPDEAVITLRRAIKRNPEHAELHFQLGTFLASCDQLEEAELRLTQALSIDRNHVDAHVSLALTCGVRLDPKQAVNLLRHAQSLRPNDARIASLLTHAVRAATQQGHAVSVRATVEGSSRVLPDRWIEQIAAIVERDPDFVDAFLSLPPGSVNTRVYENLLRTLEQALQHSPEHAELHYHCGRVLDRLDRPLEAIEQNEQAIELNPNCVRAFIELGKLYQQTNRKADATSRLEQAVRAGADYADVHFLLGNLYRDQGQVLKAKEAYRSALALNKRYEKAKHALSALPK